MTVLSFTHEKGTEVAEAKKRYTGPTEFLDVAEEDEPVRHTTVDLTQYVKQIERSQVNKAAGRAPAVGITVPEDAASFHESNFRRAADQLKVGLKFKAVPFKEATAKQVEQWNLQEGQVRLLVESKPRKVFTDEQLAARRAKLAATRQANKAKAAAAFETAKAAVPAPTPPQPEQRKRSGILR